MPSVRGLLGPNRPETVLQQLKKYSRGSKLCFARMPIPKQASVVTNAEFILCVPFASPCNVKGKSPCLEKVAFKNTFFKVMFLPNEKQVCSLNLTSFKE